MKVFSRSIISFFLILGIFSICQAQQKSEFEAAFHEYLEAARQNGHDSTQPFIIVNTQTNSLIYWNDLSLHMITDLMTGGQGVLKDNLGDIYWIEHNQDDGGTLHISAIPLLFQNEARQEALHQTIWKQKGNWHFHYQIDTDARSQGDVLLRDISCQKNHQKEWVRIFLYFILVLILYAAIIYYSRPLATRWTKFQYASFVISCLICVYLFFLYGPPNKLVSDIVFFTESHHYLNYYLPPIGRLLCQSILIFVLSTFLLRLFKHVYFKALSGGHRILITGVGYTILLISYIFYSSLSNAIIASNSEAYQFQNIYLPEWNTYFLMAIILLLVGALFYLTYLLLRISHAGNSNLGERLIIFGGVLLLTYPIFLHAPTALSPFGFYTFIFTVILLMDLFIETERKSITWLIIWLVTLSLGLASMVYAQHSVHEKDALLRQAEKIEQVQNKTSVFEQHNWAANFTKYHWIHYSKQKVINQSFPINQATSQRWLQAKREAQVSDGFLLFPIKIDELNTLVLFRPHNALLLFISLFSFIFTSLSIITILILFVNSFLNILPNNWQLKIKRTRSIRGRIQLVIFIVLMISFTAVCAITFIFLKNYQTELSDRQQNKISFEQFNYLINNIDQPERLAVNPYTLFFNQKGLPIQNVDYEADLPQRVPHKLLLNPKSKQTSVSINEETFHFYTLPFNGRIKFVAYRNSQLRQSKNYFINNLLGSLFNIYIFLLVIASSLALTFSDSITRPLMQLGEKLKSIRLGKSNERINISSDDELGALVEAYNNMLEKLENSADSFAKLEREIAWREMAKQVAHEIKNPLTPMKLSIQHLQMSIERDPERAQDMVSRVSSTMLEQIENLSKIASEFSNFAAMPTAENEKVIINEIAASVHDLFRKRDDIDVKLYVPIDDIIVFADKHYLSRVLINLIKNGIQAIPNEIEGKVSISVYKSDDNAMIKVEDNGTGIPEDIREKIFQPNFTSKNSGTGLGLAICANIVESFNGKIYFETEMHHGTSFYIEIPMMHFDDNFKTEEHVML